MENSATYSPEDNKLRLYVGRVPRDEYLKLRAEGWTSTPKQDCDFVAHWTPTRRDTALEYAGFIGDEDQSPADRAADRAERFGEYRDKRTAEATGHADTYESAPSAFGYQSQARADRAAARHDRHAGRACDAWEKAEYWQHRTAGVISHALHVSSPAVRMGRIKELETNIRRIEKSLAEYAEKHARWTACAAITDTDKQNRLALALACVEHGDYIHPRTGKKSYLYDHARTEEGRCDDPLTGAELCALWLAKHRAPRTEPGEWETHYRLRLAYENQMLEAQGGRAAFVEMQPGGWIAGRQIVKVNKSNATGRVVSVLVRDNKPSAVNHYGNPYPEGVTKILSHTIKTERLPANAYRPPTPEELAEFNAKNKAAKAAAPKADPCPLINPTDEEAERLQAIWNERAKDECETAKREHRFCGDFKPATVTRIKQATYSANAGGSYARAETRGVCRDAVLEPRFSNLWTSTGQKEREERGAKICTVRVTSGGENYYTPRSVIVLTDKPQKPFPAAVWKVKAAPAPAAPEGELFALNA